MYSNCTHISDSCSFDYTVISFSIFSISLCYLRSSCFLLDFRAISLWPLFCCEFVGLYCFFSPHFQFLQMLGFRFFSVSHSPDFDWVLCRQCIYFNEDYSCPSSVFHLFWILIRKEPPKRLKSSCIWRLLPLVKIYCNS